MTTRPGGELVLAPDLVLSRLGLGTMQLAGPGVWGPPTDPDAAVRVLRDAVDAGVTHIDTADFYGPHVVTELLRRTLTPTRTVCASRPRSVSGAAGTAPGCPPRNRPSWSTTSTTTCAGSGSPPWTW